MTRFTRWDSFETRFWSQIDKTSTCWLWTGTLNYKGYGVRIGRNSEFVYPHRISYEIHVGPIPEGLVIDHLCRVRNCVNPDHLEPVTQRENTRRGTDARWSEPCPNGHPPDGNRRTLPSGTNVCTECRRISDAKRHEKNRQARNKAGRERYAKYGHPSRKKAA